MIKEAIIKLVDGTSLDQDEAAQVMEEIMAGTATAAQMGAFLTVLRLKGETVEEIAGLAATMRARAIPVATSRTVVDTCGTGGDGCGTFNISTAAAFVAAACGVAVAKHGNRAMSSTCGSADVLEALGANVSLPAEEVALCLEEVGLGFMFAPMFHPAMRHAIGPRRELGFRTVFNVLGPLTNPAGARAQVLGVPDAVLAEKMARALQRLGTHHALVVHGSDGLDELTVSGPSVVYEVVDGDVRGYDVRPEDFGFEPSPLSAIVGGSPEVNAAIIRSVLAGEPGPRRQVVVLNAAAALVAGDVAPDLQTGVALASQAIDSGEAAALLDRFVQHTHREAVPC
ncbi:MAG: anthranilate phosphoribosyltransferase [Dehalococcoidales bacterium]|nr:anthranilate phosphoribosyltransferase [Dehalococcoidales bacterium]